VALIDLKIEGMTCASRALRTNSLRLFRFCG
jgi:hypothetical protein